MKSVHFRTKQKGLLISLEKYSQAKKERGEWDDYGRPCAMNLDDFADEYMRVQSGEIRPFELMRKLGMSKATYYRYVNRLH